MRQDLLGKGDCAQEVKLHQGIINVIAGLQAQRPLATAPVINQDIYLKLYTIEKRSYERSYDNLFKLILKKRSSCQVITDCVQKDHELHDSLHCQSAG